jgi:hypothetical protein
MAMPKKRKQSKPTAAQRQLRDEWEKMLAQHSKPLERGAKSKGVVIAQRSKIGEPFVPPSKVNVEPSRDLRRLPSLSNDVGVATKKASPQYTGSKMLGLGTMHKSNTVPVFSDEEAKDIAKMRRN